MKNQLQSINQIDQIANPLPDPILAPQDQNLKMSVLAAGGIALLGGESGVGKTAAALHLARNMAALPEGTYAPVGLGLTGKGGSVLCVTTDIAPQLISARLHALVKRENSGLMATENPSAEHCLSRIHVLNLCDDPLYRAAIPLRVADRIGGFLKNTFQKTNGLDCEETTAWNDVREAIHLIRPILVLINTAWLDRPATAARFIRSINDMAQRIREKSPDYPVPGFLLINHSSLGAFGSKDPTAYESPEAPWSAALTLARTRSKAKRVLRIVHSANGSNCLSMQLTALTPGQNPEPVLGFQSEERWVRGAYGIHRKNGPKRPKAAPKPEAETQAAAVSPPPPTQLDITARPAEAVQPAAPPPPGASAFDNGPSVEAESAEARPPGSGAFDDPSPAESESMKSEATDSWTLGAGAFDDPLPEETF